jgi:hypothetical protein
MLSTMTLTLIQITEDEISMLALSPENRPILQSDGVVDSLQVGDVSGELRSRNGSNRNSLRLWYRFGRKYDLLGHGISFGVSWERQRFAGKDIGQSMTVGRRLRHI